MPILGLRSQVQLPDRLQSVDDAGLVQSAPVDVWNPAAGSRPANVPRDENPGTIEPFSSYSAG
jgi:hypothetical protein